MKFTMDAILVSLPIEMYNDAMSFLETARCLEDKPENLLFHSHYNPDTPVNTKNISRAFKSLVRDLARRGVIQTSDLQLSSLTQFYKENAKYYTAELKKHASIKDDEFHRRLYEEKAMPFLEIEPPPPIEMYRLKKQQQKEFEKRDNEIRDLQEGLKEIQETVFPKPRKLVVVDDWEAEVERIDKWIKEHPEEAEWEERWYEQKVREQEELEEMMKRYPTRFVAYTHGLKDKIEAIQRVFQKMRERKNQETNKNSKTSETNETN